MVITAQAREIVPVKRSLAMAKCRGSNVIHSPHLLGNMCFDPDPSSACFSHFLKWTAPLLVTLTSCTQGSTLSKRENDILASFTGLLGKNGKPLL